ncbi:MAG TPA: sugar porter family MFS transporter [Terriglobales bacterium]|nr:sugar porter family MFS transporter [Terriglobales bacterium]
MSASAHPPAGSISLTSNPYLMRSILVGALAGLLFGFDTAVISGTTGALRAVYQLSPAQLGFTVSAALWGTVIGALCAGVIAQRFGGRRSMSLTALFYMVSALGCALAWSWSAVIGFRFIGGLGIGASSVVAPVYLAELAPARARGRLVGVFQINIVVGILVAYLSNYLISRVGLGIREWRWEFGVAAVPALVFFILLFGIPESPRWLVTRGRTAEAAQVLDLLGNSDGEAALQEIVRSVHLTRSGRSEPLFSSKYRFPIFLAVSVAFFNQFAGINAILYYANDIFAMGGYSKLSANLQAVAIGLTNLVFTLMAMAVIDRVGRKTLLLIGAVGMAACLLGVSAIFFTRQHQQALLTLLIVYVAFFAFSQGAVIWVFISEVFPNLVRARGQSLGSGTHWVMNAIIGQLFPIFAARSGGYPFLLFGVMMVIQFLVVLVVYPETKGFTLEQMEDHLGIEQA